MGWTPSCAGTALQSSLLPSGVSAFSRHVEKSPKGLQSLSLARTMFTAKGRAQMLLPHSTGVMEGLQAHPGEGTFMDAMSCCPSWREAPLLCSLALPVPRACSHAPHFLQAGMSTLCKALTDNKATGFSLRHLDLSGNPGTLAGDDISVSTRAVMGGVTHSDSVPSLVWVALVCSALCPALCTPGMGRSWLQHPGDTLGTSPCISLWQCGRCHLQQGCIP